MRQGFFGIGPPRDFHRAERYSYRSKVPFCEFVGHLLGRQEAAT